MKSVILLLLLAWRNIFRNRRRSLLTLGAIALALTSLLIFLGLKRGLHDKMVQGVVTLHLGLIQVQPAGYQHHLTRFQPLNNPGHVTATLREQGLSAAPRLSSPALVLADRGSVSVLLTGVDPSLEAEATIIARQVIAGRYLESSREVLLSRRLATSLGLQPGDSLRLMLQDTTGRAQVHDLPVGGLYATSLASFDQTNIFLDIIALQELLAAPGAVGAVTAALPPLNGKVPIPSGTEMHYLLNTLRQELDSSHYQVVPWQDGAPDVQQLIELNNGTMRLLIGIVFILVGLGITNTMTMSVYERFREFGVLASNGLTPEGLVLLVLAEAGILGLAASLVGSLLGGAACLWLASHGIDLTRLTSTNQYFADSHLLKAVLSSSDFLLANGVTLLTALGAGLLPALHAATLEPAESLRHV